MVLRPEPRLWIPISWAVTLLMGMLVGCRPGTPVTPTAAARASAPAAATAVTTRRPTVVAQAVTTEAPTVTATARLTPKPTATFTLSPTSGYEPEGAETVTFTIVYDNNACPGCTALRTSWGFACWIQSGETTVLFDTGGDGTTLMHNLGELRLDPRSVDAVVLSHAHGDHTGGLGSLLSTGVKPTVYVPASFSRAFKEGVRARTDLVEVTGATTVAPGIHTTGEIGTGIIEQALAVETGDGLVVVTGCAHPGVDRMVRRAHEAFDDQIALVVGGFHLGGASRRRVESIIGDFNQLGVQSVAPCHCTGDAARRMFQEAFGDECVLAGVGWSTEYALEGRD